MSAAAVEQETIEIAPQPGPQTDFLSTTADIAFYGGSAGGGKSYALIIEPLRHYENPLFGGVIFRRNGVDIRNEGGLWDESEKVYGSVRGHPREAFMEWIFPPGSRMKFAHLEHEKTVLNWQGAQIPYEGFDELTHFTENQFIYMMSRNRSTSGVPGYIRGTCNPDVDSWVRKWVDWWIDPETGLPIPERAGVIRYFIRIDGVLYWGDTKEELIEKYGSDQLPKSFTFIPAKLEDNKILMDKDPTYRSNLNALQRVDRMRLKDGNWNVRAQAGMFFRKGWFKVVESYNKERVKRIVRSWDRAATEPSEANLDPDWTSGVKIIELDTGQFIIADVAAMRGTPGEVEDFVKNTATQDGYDVEIVGQQDPGSAGVADVARFTQLLNGFVVKIEKVTTDKETRAKPVSSACEHGNVLVLRGAWNDAFFKEAESFPTKGVHDDTVDALSVGFNELAQEVSVFDNL